ncbi:glutathione hydrolase 1 proenzyme-like isoform X2 [Pomacea canaliculata]|nr:glutathione hydrolase 1 proenzyme-like isoform X2 [Pomacea canaliculata]
MGIADAQSMGVGGGFFMTIYNRTTQKAIVVDARETAPGLANESMFEGNPASSSIGPLSIAVPGEIRGYWLAHQNFGSMPWKELFSPAINMARNGFQVPESLASALQTASSYIMNETSLREVFVNPNTQQLYKQGESMRRPQLADTLEKISNGGAAALYDDGQLLDDLIADLQDIGSIITKEDLKNYTALLKIPINATLTDGVTMFSPPPPSSGVVLSFMLNVLKGYKFTPKSIEDVSSSVLTMHRIIETFKFAYAKRTDLGDPDYVNVTDLIANLTSNEYADAIRQLITDNTTHNISYYGPTFYDRLTTGTAHLSVVDAEGNAVAVTSTVNARFGSKRRGSRTGIIFNDEMDDFSSPNITNIFGLPPSPANFIFKGKRPLSSMCPSIFTNPNGSVRLVVGAAGGTYITTSTAYVAVRQLWLGNSMEQAVEARRLHHQLLPDYITYEEDFDMAIVKGLQALGHEVQSIALGKSIIQAISGEGGMLHAVSDFRKGGHPDGY